MAEDTTEGVKLSPNKEAQMRREKIGDLRKAISEAERRTRYGYDYRLVTTSEWMNDINHVLKSDREKFKNLPPEAIDFRDNIILPTVKESLDEGIKEAKRLWVDIAKEKTESLFGDYWKRSPGRLIHEKEKEARDRQSDEGLKNLVNNITYSHVSPWECLSDPDIIADFSKFAEGYDKEVLREAFKEAATLQIMDEASQEINSVLDYK